jgi:hypothetical protein
LLFFLLDSRLLLNTDTILLAFAKVQFWELCPKTRFFLWIVFRTKTTYRWTFFRFFCIASSLWPGLTDICTWRLLHTGLPHWKCNLETYKKNISRYTVYQYKYKQHVKNFDFVIEIGNTGFQIFLITPSTPVIFQSLNFA